MHWRTSTNASALAPPYDTFLCFHVCKLQQAEVVYINYTKFLSAYIKQAIIDVHSPIKQCNVGTQPMQEPIIVRNLLRLILASDSTTQMVVYVAIQTMKYQVGANRKRHISFWYLLHSRSRSSSTLVLVV